MLSYSNIGETITNQTNDNHSNLYASGAKHRLRLGLRGKTDDDDDDSNRKNSDDGSNRKNSVSDSRKNSVSDDGSIKSDGSSKYISDDEDSTRSQ